ncbi:unnamed protein product [Dibothriocephalus latus]|uniref:Uncharacterized protein n=1 Tax=Dibothriocephalus latus TaxID=60516 RepID=A0A3P7NRJ5_DIBLA|nr:unnamed protein product [Dibothriocephalus latus]
MTMGFMVSSHAHGGSAIFGNSSLDSAVRRFGDDRVTSTVPSSS